MTLTVLMPVYNGEKYLSEAVESILNQTYSDFEFLIIDDGSTDRTGELLKQYAESDKRIRLVQHAKNLGLVRTLNEGLTLASGDWIARMDADDVSLSSRFEKQVGYLKKHPNVVLVGTQITVMDEIHHKQWLKKNPIESNSIRFYACLNSPFFHPTVMMKKEIILKVGGYKQIAHAEDYDLWSEIIYTHTTANLDETLLLYRRYEGSSTVSKAVRDRQIEQATLIANKNIRRLFPNHCQSEYEHFHGFTKLYTLNWRDIFNDWIVVRKMLSGYILEKKDLLFSFRLYLLRYLFNMWFLKMTITSWPEKRALVKQFFLNDLRKNLIFGFQLLFS